MKSSMILWYRVVNYFFEIRVFLDSQIRKDAFPVAAHTAPADRTTHSSERIDDRPDLDDELLGNREHVLDVLQGSGLAALAGAGRPEFKGAVHCI